MPNTKKTIYNKLVRDRIPEVLEKKGLVSTVHVATEKEYAEALKKKLEEELNEYLADETQEELADILEVLEAIISLKGWQKKEVEETRVRKAETRGVFEKRIILESVEEELS